MKCEQHTSLPVPAVEYSETSSLDTTQLLPSNGIHTPAKYCANASPAFASSKEMSEKWTFQAWLASMQSALDSLVRTYRQQEADKESKAKEVDCLERSCVQLTLFDQIGFSLKTAPESEPKDGISSSVNSWRVDIPVETESLGRLMSERPTNEIDGGALQNVPTPTVCGNYNRKGASKTSGDGLATFAKKWPTPTRRDYRSGKAELNENGIRISKTNGIAHCKCLVEMVFHRQESKDIGTLNPEWVEWLQGFPIGHTELKCSEMPKSHSALRRRGDCSEAHK